MHKIIEYIDDKLKDFEKKVGNGGELSEREIEYGKDLAKFKMALLTNERMESDSGYSEGMRRGYYHDGDMSYADSRAIHRDGVGRFSRNNGYSYEDAREDMLSDLHKIMRKAPDEKTKREFKSFIDKLDTM